MTMASQVQLRVNGRLLTVPAGTVVAAAVAQAGVWGSRHSVLGQPRGPLCGMGICMECRVTVDGQPQVRGCLTLCADGMEVLTDE
jgi:sarcosine oxidase subunit alpha